MDSERSLETTLPRKNHGNEKKSSRRNLSRVVDLGMSWEGG
jgi:hypothetical protein